ncbi:hypothetical protein IGB42_03009 [Andreprevotia sp. IGB-42]|uniref:hypothetical protein n=1 Tax=Andreprevotia sp. IGB-42 TaxID=2497473 RepID=UPI00135C289E|nr:hypothetical protein [Andreprevotia sp. IGB-42]KAF0812717.1 hypothetical protein IGB42_03009 [Andreprevotia sp. IGB-42]
MTFKKEFLKNKADLISVLEERGFTVIWKVLDLRFAATKPLSEFLDLVLLLSPWVNGSFQASLLIKVKNVGPFAGLEPVEKGEDGICVSSVDLNWLRINAEPEKKKQYEDDYVLKSDLGTQRVLHDLDTVGFHYLESCVPLPKLAQFLLEIEAYPRKTKMGGEPVSADPFVYAAAIYILLGDVEKSKAALQKGSVAFCKEKATLQWQIARCERFKISRKFLETFFVD